MAKQQNDNGANKFWDAYRVQKCSKPMELNINNSESHSLTMYET